MTALLLRSLRAGLKQTLSQILNGIMAWGPSLFRGFHSLLYPSRLFGHYRRSYHHSQQHWRRRLLWRQCFYFGFSLSCFAGLLLSAWLLISARQWQHQLQGRLQGLFASLEQQYGIQLRFRLQTLHLLHRIRLSDIQLRLEVPIPRPGSSASFGAEPAVPAQVRSIPLLPGSISAESPDKKHRAEQTTRSISWPATTGAGIPLFKEPAAFSRLLRQWLRELPPDQHQAMIQALAPDRSGDRQGAGTRAAMLVRATQAPGTVTDRSNVQHAQAQDVQAQHVQLYLSVDRLHIRFSLPALLSQSWQLLRQMLRSQLDHDPLDSVAEPGLLQELAELRRNGLSGGRRGTDKDIWRLFELLQNVRKLRLGAVQLQIYTSPLNGPVQVMPETGDPTAKLSGPRTASEPLIWQELLQNMRGFPIEVRSLQLDFNFYQQIFEGQGIRFLLQRQETAGGQNSLPHVLGPANAASRSPRPSGRARPSGGARLWQRLRSRIPAVQVASAQLPREPTQESSYLFDLRGSFRSRLSEAAAGVRTEAAAKAPLSFWGQLHASGGLSGDFSQAYLIMELQEFHSNYASLRPIQFKVEYRPDAVRLQVLSGIRQLDWQLHYRFAEQSVQLDLQANDFRLGNYFELPPQNSENRAFVRAVEPFLGTRLNGESSVQVLLPRRAALPQQSSDLVPAVSRKNLQLLYRADLKAYLSGLRLAFAGEGDLQSLRAHKMEASRQNGSQNWRVDFRGDLPYHSLLPSGKLQVQWQGRRPPAAATPSSPFSYRGEFLLRRSSAEQQNAALLLIDTLRSRFSGPGLPEELSPPSAMQLLSSLSIASSPASSGSTNPALGSSAYDSAQAPVSVELLNGPPPWAQPQLRMAVVYRQQKPGQHNYTINTQLRLPLSREQMRAAEQRVGPTLYRGSPLYPGGAVREYSRPAGGEGRASPPVPYKDSVPIAAGSFRQEAELADPAFYLLPVLSLSGSLHRNSTNAVSLAGSPPSADVLGSRFDRPADPVGPDRTQILGTRAELEAHTLEWDAAQKHFGNGQVALYKLLGRELSPGLEFLFPGLSDAALRINGSLISDFQSFQFWLDEFRIQGRESAQEPNREWRPAANPSVRAEVPINDPDTQGPPHSQNGQNAQAAEGQQFFLLRGTANPRQIDLEQLQLRWDRFRMDNRFLWNIEERSGQGLLRLQNRDLNYSLKHLQLPSTRASGDASLAAEEQSTGPEAGRNKQVWLLQGDYQLYAYFNSQRYQATFQQLPLPSLPGLEQFLSARPGQILNASAAEHSIELGSRLSLNVSGNYPLADYRTGSRQWDLRNWHLNISRLRLQIPEGTAYFKEGAELSLAGFWHPEQLKLQQLVLLEPRRRLQGQGSLRLLRPAEPVSPAARPAQPAPGGVSSLPDHAERPTHDQAEWPGEVPKEGRASPIIKSDPGDNAVVSVPHLTTQQARAPALPLPRELQREDLASQEVEAQGPDSYWLGNFQLQGFLTELGIRQGAGQIEGAENLRLEFSTEENRFNIKGEGWLDATRFTRLFSLLRNKAHIELDRGAIHFVLESQGQLRGRLQDQLRALSDLDFEELRGNWQLSQASYANRELDIGSQILWHRGRGSQNGTSDAWLFSDIKGNFGKLFFERSFLSFYHPAAALPNSTEQRLSGLLNYIVRMGADHSYRSSLSFDLQRSLGTRAGLRTTQIPVSAALPVASLSPLSVPHSSPINSLEQELLRWRGRLYSYPLRSYSLSSGEQSSGSGSIRAIASNLRNNVFADTSTIGRQEIRQIYPGFDLFLESRLVPVQAPENTTVKQPEAGTATEQQLTGELRLFRHRPEDFEMGIRVRGFWLNIGKSYPLSFRASGHSNGQDIDAQVEELLIKPQLLNILMPEDAIMKQPVLRLEEGQISGRLRLHGKLLDPLADGSLRLENIRLQSPYFPGEAPILNIQLVSKGHIIMAQPFRIRFQNGELYSSGYESAYLRHRALQISRYYLGFSAKGKEGIPIFYDAYGIQYAASARGSATLEGDEQSTYLNADLEFNRLLMQGSPHHNTLASSDPGHTRHPFSLDIRAKIGSSASLVYPQEASPIFDTRLNPRDELLVSYDGRKRQGSLEGRITLYDGQLYLLGNQMSLDKGELIFDESFNDFSPDINLLFSLHTYDQQGQNIRINMDYQGDLTRLAAQDWKPALYSRPPLAEPELRQLIAAQFGSGGSVLINDPSLRQNQLFSNVLSRLGSSVVLKPVEEIVRKAFKFDEVSLKTDLLGNLLNDYWNINYRLSGPINGSGLDGGSRLNNAVDSDSGNWLKYLDKTHISFGSYIDRDNSILLSFNIDLLYKPQDTSPVFFAHNGLQIVPGIGLKFNTPLIDITWDIGVAHYNDFLITDSSLLLEWSLSDFLSRRRLAALEYRQDREDEGEELIPYSEK